MQKETTMAKKAVETQKAPNGKFIWEIGEVDNIVPGFGCLFVDAESGKWSVFDAEGKPTNQMKYAVDIKYTGDFYNTRAEALAAGKAQLKDWEENGWPDA